MYNLLNPLINKIHCLLDISFRFLLHEQDFRERRNKRPGVAEHRFGCDWGRQRANDHRVRKFSPSKFLSANDFSFIGRFKKSFKLTTTLEILKQRFCYHKNIERFPLCRN